MTRDQIYHNFEFYQEKRVDTEVSLGKITKEWFNIHIAAYCLQYFIFTKFDFPNFYDLKNLLW